MIEFFSVFRKDPVTPGHVWPGLVPMKITLGLTDESVSAVKEICASMQEKPAAVNIEAMLRSFDEKFAEHAPAW